MREHTHIDSTSGDATLRGYAPLCLREPYLRALGARGLPSRRLTWAIGFAETAIRLLIATLAPEAGRPQIAGQAWRPARPLSTGGLLTVALKLAKAVGPGAVAAPFAAVLWDHRRGKATAITTALQALIETRNVATHGALGPSTDADAHWASVAPHLRTLTNGLTCLIQRPIYALDDYDPAFPQPRLLCFAGAEPTPLPLSALPTNGLPVRQPLLIDEAGRWVSLAPLLSLGASEAGLVPRLFGDQHRHPDHFLDPISPQPVAPSPTWRALWAAKTPAEVWGAPARSAPCDVLAEALAAPPTGPNLGPDYTATVALERGSSAVIWKVVDRDGRPFAAKVLHPSLRASAHHRARLDREVALLTRLQHPHIVRTHGLIPSCPDGPVMLMDLVTGADLSRAYGAQPATERAACHIVDALLSALAHLHVAGGVHRDVKPANVLLDHQQQVVLVDLGVARDSDRIGLTQALDALGTLRYAAPEQFTGEAVDGRADLYATGRLLAWLCGGDAALAPNGYSLLPPRIAAVVRRATRTAPAERYANAEAMRVAVAAVLDGSAANAPLSTGDRLAGTLVVTDEPDGVAPGVWRAVGRDDTFQEEVRIWTAALGTPAADQLTRAARDSGERRAFAEDGLWCVVTARDTHLAGLGPLDPPRPKAPPPADPPPRPPSVSQARDAWAFATCQAVSPAEALKGIGDWLTHPPAWRGVLPAVPTLASLPPAALGRQIALEGWLTLAALDAATHGSTTLARWFRRRVTWQQADPDPAARLASALRPHLNRPGAQPLRWALDVALRGDPLDGLPALRDTLEGLHAGGVRLAPLLTTGPALVWHARAADGARTLNGAHPAPLPADEAPAILAAWLDSGLHGLGLKDTRRDADLHVGQRDRRPLAVTLAVNALPGNPLEKLELARHMRGIAAIGIRLVGLTDGAEWRWLRRVGTRELRAVDGDPRAALRG